MGKASLPGAYFDEVYRHARDPWEFETSPYERDKYRDTLGSLPRERYCEALEVGCSIGVLTALLAPRCDRLLSIDISEAALGEARKRCAALPQVRFAHMRIPDQAPAGRFDLLLVSEVAYYWSAEDLERAASLLAERHLPGGHLLLVHFTPPVHDYPITGDEVHELWRARGEWRLIEEKRRERYRLDVLERV